MTKYIYKPISNSNNFGGRRPKSAIKYIAMHWTSNTSPTATAMNHYRFFQNSNPGTSAHYFVDELEIVQIVGDTTIAYAVGGNQGYGVALNGCTNYNSISIEMCVNNGYSDKMLFNAIELVKNLLAIYPHAIVCRHWDATRKDCPKGWEGNNNKKWNWFLEEIKKPRKMLIDLSKTSDCKMVGQGENSVKQNSKPVCVMYFKDGNKTTAEFIAQQLECKCFKDNGKDLPKSEYPKYDIKYIGDLGKTRQDTAKEACRKFLNWKI